MFNLRKIVLILNGLFLGLTGFAQMIFELLSHFRGTGPLESIFTDSAYTIGFFEAHGFALLTGILVFTVMIQEMKTHWHLYLAGVSFLLGGSNLLFWDSFAKVGLVTAGYVATILHIVFFALQIFFYVKARSNREF